MVLCCATQMPTVRPFTGRNQKVFQITVLLPALFSPWCPSMCPKEAFSHAIAKPPMKQFSFWKASCLALGCVLTWCQLRAAGLVSKMERERENTQFIFLFVPVVVITGVMGATFQVNFYQTLYFIHLKTQSLGGIDKHPGPGVVKRWLHGCLGQGCRSKPGTATCCCLAVHISWAPRSSWMNSMQNWFLGLVGLVDRS